MEWPNIIRAFTRLVMSCFDAATRRQRQLLDTQFNAGFILGRQVALEQVASTLAAGESLLDLNQVTPTPDEINEFRALAHFSKGQPEPARDWLILDRQPNQIVDHTAMYDAIRCTRPTYRERRR